MPGRARSRYCRAASQKLRPNRRYHRTQRTIISASKWRPLNSAARFRLMLAEAYQTGWNTVCNAFATHPVRRLFSRYIQRESTVLDVGCGYGQFINAVECRSKLAMDMNPDASTYLHFVLRFLQQDCSTRWPLADGALDVVFTSNFLEHLPSKSTVSSTLRGGLSLFAPGRPVHRHGTQHQMCSWSILGFF